MAQVYRQSNQENLEQAFGMAERELGVTRLLDPEGESSQRCWQRSTCRYLTLSRLIVQLCN